MNIDQYRALKAQEAQQQKEQPNQQQPVQPTQPVVPEKTEPKQETPVVPEKVKIDGVGEVTLDELKKGYMRTTDYTRKTQEIAHQRNEVKDALTLYEQLRQNPQLVQQIKESTQVPPSVDPATQHIRQLEQKMYDKMLELDIATLSAKYNDFDYREVLQVAQEKQIPNLEDAYLVLKSAKQSTPQSVDVEALKKQLRDEILKEVKTDTSTIIAPSGGGQLPVNQQPTLSPDEQKVARMMFRTFADPNAEYIKWRDAGSRNVNKK